MKDTKAKRSSGPSVIMAIATFSSSFRPLSGKVGGLIFKHYGNKVVVTRAPVFTKPWTPAQQAARRRFAEASAYARTVQNDPVLRAKYARTATRRGLTIRAVAISAWLQGKAKEPATPQKPGIRSGGLSVAGVAEAALRCEDTVGEAQDKTGPAGSATPAWLCGLRKPDDSKTVRESAWRIKWRGGGDSNTRPAV